VVKSLCWIREELRDSSKYDGIGDIDDFLVKMEELVAEVNWVGALNVTLKCTLF
jgi:hypothetical protein